MCALRKVRNYNTNTVKDDKTESEAVSNTTTAYKIPNINTENVVKPYINSKKELLYSHPCFEWLKYNINLISDDALKCYISNLVILGGIGKEYFSNIITGRDGALTKYTLLYSNAEDNYNKGVLRVASYDALYTLGYFGENYGGSNPAEEIITNFEEECVKEIGLIKSPKGIYYVNPNVFQRHFFSRVNIINYNQEYYIYDLSGHYRKTDILEIKKIAKSMIHEVKNDIWNVRMEKDIWNALNLEIPTVAAINKHKEYINLNNGMYNIYTKKLEPHDPKFLSTIRVPINYNVSAKCPTFVKFLNDLMQGDGERIVLCEEIMGYCLTLLNCIQKGFFFYGTGGNGKSKYAELISYMCGKDNVANIPLEVLGTRFGTETLPNKLVNISPENEFNGKYMDTSNFKSITGGDTMHVDGKYKTAKSQDIVAKLISLLNKLPNTKDTSDGYFRRVLIIPFYNVFTGKSDDKEIVDKLLNELEGILIVALEGLTRLINNNFNLTESKVSNELFNQYRLEQNRVEEFFKDKVICKKDTEIKQPDILKHFRRWAVENGYDDWSNIGSTMFWNSFRKILTDNGISYHNTKKIRGITYIIGITIE